MAAISAVKAIFPLHDHAEMLVVQDDRLCRDPLDVRGRQFLNVHQEGAVAIDVDDLFVRVCHLRAQRRRVAKAHRAQARRGDEGARRMKL